MKVRRQVIKTVRSCDDDWDDYPPYYETGQSYELGQIETPRLRSVSPAAHAAIHMTRPRPIGFHKPKAN